ncbi:ABC-F family ATP-binding cassette domain-containing protein [Bacteroidota bacterium]
MNVVSVSKACKSFGEKILFEDLTLGIHRGDKIALIGVNGCGKSTFLEIIAGIRNPDTGEVVVRKDTRIAYLPQNPVFDPSKTIIEDFYSIRNDNISLILEYEKLVIRKMQDATTKKLLEEYAHKLDSRHLWNYENQIKQILGKLGIYNLDQKIGNLSGGQQKRVAIAKTLLEEPDLLILDEPTNHLDLDTIEWFENYLQNQQLSLILVTHDRYFLENITNRIVELEQGELISYKGSYQQYLEKKTEREEFRKREVDKARNLMRKELEWMQRMPKARGSKSRGRIDRFHELQKKANVRLDKMGLNLDTEISRTGKKILELKKISLQYDHVHYIKGFSYTFKKHDRIGVIGPNGCGKSSLMDLLTEQLDPNDGNIVKGATLKIGYYTQKELEFDLDQRVIDIIQEKAEIFKMPDGKMISASQMLDNFLFPSSQQYDFIRKLSGGEKRRLQLLLVLIENPNFLILDEPTNDFDLISLNVLEDFLEQYRGCLVIVSHDRYFMDLLVDHLFVFSGNGAIDDFPGNYTDFRERKLKTSDKDDSQQKKAKPRITKEKKKQRLNFNEKREFDSLSKELEMLEEQKNDLIAKMNAGSDDHQLLTQWSNAFNEISRIIDEKSDRWLELSEYVD